MPTPSAWALGWKSAGLVLDRHRQEHGNWPRALVLSAWGTANMRTGGDDIAQALALIGARPTWDVGASGRVAGFEILPLSLLDRPRVDVTLRVSGFFRDAFPAQIDLFDSAVRAIAELDEPEHLNPIAARVRAESAELIAQGADAKAARRKAAFRVFGSKPGAYGAGLQALIDERGWSDEGDFARAYLAWGGYAYGNGAAGEAAQSAFSHRLSEVDAVLHNQDNREHDLLDSDDYYQFEGGLAATIKHLTGRKAQVWHNDHSRPENPQVRSLEEEIARVVRARVVNPKWIKGVMRHGYKGAFEMAATVDYLFAFAATADCVADHHFDLVFDAYLGDDAVRDFIERHNPAALKEIAERLLEAQERDLWKPKSNAAHARLGDWAGTHSCNTSSLMTEDADDLNRRADEKSAKRKEARDKMMAAKTIEKGLLIVHTGKGKGKSTAAFGMVMRCIGHGMKVGVIQFIKGKWDTGERWVLEKFPELCTIKALGEGFTWETQDRARDVAHARAAWEEGKTMMADPGIKLVLLDELNIALRYDYLPIEEVVATLKARRPDLHVIVTGRNAKDELIAIADLVTEMELVKHPFRDGVKAQKGIEF